MECAINPSALQSTFVSFSLSPVPISSGLFPCSGRLLSTGLFSGSLSVSSDSSSSYVLVVVRLVGSEIDEVDVLDGLVEVVIGLNVGFVGNGFDGFVWLVVVVVGLDVGLVVDGVDGLVVVDDGCVVVGLLVLLVGLEILDEVVEGGLAHSG